MAGSPAWHLHGVGVGWEDLNSNPFTYVSNTLFTLLTHQGVSESHLKKLQITLIKMEQVFLLYTSLGKQSRVNAVLHGIRNQDYFCLPVMGGGGSGVCTYV